MRIFEGNFDEGGENLGRKTSVSCVLYDEGSVNDLCLMLTVEKVIASW